MDVAVLECSARLWIVTTVWEASTYVGKGLSSKRCFRIGAFVSGKLMLLLFNLLARMGLRTLFLVSSENYTWKSSFAVDFPHTLLQEFKKPSTGTKMFLVRFNLNVSA